MGRGGPRILEDFILPHLRTRYFGDRLVWKNQQEKIFDLCWKHKSSPTWTPDDTMVFKEWDKLKKRTIDGIDYEMKAKGRFRAALRKIPTVLELGTPNKQIKRYQIISVQKRGKKYKQEYKIPSSPEGSISFYSSSSSDSPTYQIFADGIEDGAAEVDEEQSPEMDGRFEYMNIVSFLNNSRSHPVLPNPAAFDDKSILQNREIFKPQAPSPGELFLSSQSQLKDEVQFDLDHTAIYGIDLNEVCLEVFSDYINSNEIPLDNVGNSNEVHHLDGIDMDENLSFDPENFLTKTVF